MGCDWRVGVFSAQFAVNDRIVAAVGLLLVDLVVTRQQEADKRLPVIDAHIALRELAGWERQVMGCSFCRDHDGKIVVYELALGHGIL